MSIPKKRAEPLIVSDYGILYRISRRNWLRYCKDYVKTEGMVSLQDYYPWHIGHVEHNITDWKVEDFREHLEMEE
jgi:hypothetical protein